MKTAIIITTYNRPEYTKKCFESINSTFIEKGTLLFIIDDCSTDHNTLKLIKDFKKEGCKIKKLIKKENHGITDSLLTGYDFCFKNGYNYVIVLNSDAIVNNYFFDMMTYWHKIFPDNIINGFNTLTLSELGSPRHPIIEDFKGYCTKKTSGGLCFGINKQTYEKYFRPTILENIRINKKDCYDTKSCNKASNDGYIVICTKPSVCEHIGIDSAIGHHFNPDVSIDFKPYIELANSKKLITVNLATYPARQKALKILIEKLLTIDIIDKIRIYLNEYKEVPEFCKHDKITTQLGENFKDTGKFYWAGDYKNEIYFTADDDILIDENYIKKHLSLLELNPNCFISLHGKVLRENPTSFTDVVNDYHYIRKVFNDEFINFPGTGVMCFDNSIHKIPLDYFQYHGMTDLWIAKYCQENEIPCLIRKHENKEVNLIYDEKDTLWNQRNIFIKQHKEILDSIPKWRIFTGIKETQNTTGIQKVMFIRPFNIYVKGQVVKKKLRDAEILRNRKLVIFV